MICVFLSTQTWDPVSATIRWNTRCPYSHAGFLDTTTDMTFSAMLKGGVAFRTLKELKPSKVLMLQYPGVDRAFSWAVTQVGKPYDWRAISGLAFDRDWRKGDAWFCSEIVAAAFEEASAPLFSPHTHVWRITPRDLLLPSNVTVLGELPCQQK